MNSFMRFKKVMLISSSVFLFACNEQGSSTNTSGKKNEDLSALLNNYWEERMKLFPLEATANGDNRYNDQMTITISDSFRDSLKSFYSRNLDALGKIDSVALNTDEKLS